MHRKRSRFASILAVGIVIALSILIAKSGIEIKQPVVEEETVNEEESFLSDKETIYIWYTDAALTEYMQLAAVNYNAEKEDIRVVPVLKSGMEYIENISQASVDNDSLPDLYVTTNDTLEKAHLAGLAEEIEVPEGRELENFFPGVAIDSVTYSGEVIAYPLYYECSALLYNSTYLDAWARASLEAEIRSEMAETEDQSKEKAVSDKEATKNMTDEEKKAYEEKKAEEAKKAEEELAAQISAMVSDSEVQAFVDEYFPSDVNRLLAFSDMYDAPENVDTIFKWAVTDIFYNYFFIGDAINVGGLYGDNADQIDIYNENAIKGLQTYQNLNQFFSISTDDVSYSGVIEEFMEGKIVLTIATTDSLRILEEAKDQGNIDFDYRFALLPDIKEGTKAKSMSVTDVIAVNGYSVHREAANEFAAYLCEQDARALYERSGKVSALKDTSWSDDTEAIEVFAKEYDNSVPLPKMLETSNYWVELEMLFASVWDGADANDGLKTLSEKMKLQVTGEPVTEQVIIIEEEVAEEDEIIETDTLEE